MGARKFNFAPKFPQSGGFLVPNFVFLDVDFPTRRKFVDGLKFRASRSCYDAIVSWNTLPIAHTSRVTSRTTFLL